MIDDLNSSPLSRLCASGAAAGRLRLRGCAAAASVRLEPSPARRGPVGLAVAGAVCLVAGWVAEGLAYLLHDRVAPLGVMLIGMAFAWCRRWESACSLPRKAPRPRASGVHRLPARRSIW